MRLPGATRPAASSGNSTDPAASRLLDDRGGCALFGGEVVDLPCPPIAPGDHPADRLVVEPLAERRLQFLGGERLEFLPQFAVDALELPGQRVARDKRA